MATGREQAIDHVESADATSSNGAPTGEPEVWDERIPLFNPLFGHAPEPVQDVPEYGPDFDVEQYVGEERTKDLLRFSTAGSVDDGKSTLIGRLLYDTQSVYDDQLQSIEGKGTTAPGVLDLALLTDGLRAEREQGITIDVAYRYFTTGRRKFIIADTPGHEQYTRNMATGASTASLALVLVDARKGVLIQSRRHACITALLGVPHLVVAVNKMDLVEYREEIFAAIERDFRAFFAQLASLGEPALHFVPVSALAGDNVVRRSNAMPWYRGSTLLELLEQVPAAESQSEAAFRMPVQRVLRPDLDFRGFAGQIASGTVRRGDEITVLPSGRSSRVRSIVTFGGELDEAFAPQSVTLTLDDELDISRGDLLSCAARPTLATRFSASLVWMAEQPLARDRRYLLKHGSRLVSARVRRVVSRLDVTTLEHVPADTLTLNGIGTVELECVQALAFDVYRENRTLGSFVLIDTEDNATVAGGMIRAALADGDVSAQPVTTEERTRRWGHAAALVQVSGEGAFVDALERVLFDRGALVVRADRPAPQTIAALLQAGALVLSATAGDVPAIVVNAGETHTVSSVEEAVMHLEAAAVLLGDKSR